LVSFGGYFLKLLFSMIRVWYWWIVGQKSV